MVVDLLLTYEEILFLNGGMIDTRGSRSLGLRSPCKFESCFRNDLRVKAYSGKYLPSQLSWIEQYTSNVWVVSSSLTEGTTIYNYVVLRLGNYWFFLLKSVKMCKQIWSRFGSYILGISKFDSYRDLDMFFFEFLYVSRVLLPQLNG